MGVRAAKPSLPIEPLFVQGTRAWLWVWLAYLLFTLVGAFLLTVQGARSWSAFAGQAGTPALVAISCALVGWSVFHLVRRDLLFGRPGRMALFVAGCWAAVGALSLIGMDFTYVAFALILQVFIFLPFRWSFLAVGLFVVVGMLASISPPPASPVVELLAAVLVMLGLSTLLWALVFYVGRANRETRLREALITQLEEAQQRLVDREREAGVLAERARLSRDLHDTLAQGLASVVAQLSAAELVLSRPEPEARERLALAREIARGSMADIRRVVWALRPAELTEGGRVDSALARLTKSWARQTGAGASFQVSGQPRALLPDVEIALLRVLQEALSNVARHARARGVEVRLTFEAEFVMLDVTDDGVGFDVDAPPGLGLTGMRERLEGYAGQLMLESVPFEGTIVTAAVPLHRATPAPVTS